MTIGTEVDNYVIKATGKVLIPTAGTWSFDVNSDDGFRLTVGTNTFAYDGGRGASDSFGTFTFASSGYYDISLLMFQGNGGSSVEVSAMSGDCGNAWSGSFRLIGDTTNGGLSMGAIFSVAPFSVGVTALGTGDGAPALGGTISASNVSVTARVGGTYYAATTSLAGTWSLPRGMIQPPLASGTYDVSACGVNTAGQIAFDSSPNELVIDSTPPTATIDAVTPNPRTTPLDSVTIRFSEPVSNFDLADVHLTRNNGSDLITGAETLSTSDQTVWTLSNLSPLTAAFGSYTLTLQALASGITDGSGNALAANAVAPWLVQAPAVAAAITAVAPDPRNTAVAQVTITFSQAVTGFDLGDLTLTRGGNAVSLGGATLTSGDGGITWTLGNLGGMTGTQGNYVLTLVAAGSGIQDASNDPLAGNASDAWVVDTTPPAVVSINRSGASPTNAGSVQFGVIFSELVTGVDIADFALSLSGVTGTIASVSGSGTSYVVTVNGITGNGTLGLNLVDDDSIVDAATNKLGGTGTGNGNFTGQVYAIDTLPPGVQSINRSGASPTNLASVQFAVTFSESVTGVDTGDFTLVLSGATGTIASVTGSGASYTVTVNGISGTGTLGLNLVDDDSIIDLATNKLGGTGTGNGNFTGQVYAVDTVAPGVVSINRSGTNPTNLASVQFAVTFSESVTGVDMGDFTLSLSGATGTIASVTGSGASYTVTVNGISGTGTVGLNLVDDDSIIDLATNKLGGAGTGNGNFTGQVYTVDTVAPSVVSINRSGASPTNAASVQFAVTFSENVTGVDTTDFALALSGTGGAVASVSGSGTSYTVTVNGVSGNGTLGLNLVDDDSIIDGTGNRLGGTGTGNGNFTGQVFTIDTAFPTVASINRSGASPTNAGSVQFAVTFSESVTGVDTTDFALALSGAAGTIGSVAGSGASYTVTINSVSGNGTLGLNLVDDDSIIDLAANKLGGTGTGNGNFTGQTFTIDTKAPTATSINRVGASPTNAASLDFAVTFSESVTGVDATDFALAMSGVTANIASITGSGSAYTVTVSASGTGTVGLNLVDDDTIVDLAGNKLGGTGVGNGNLTGQVYTIDTNAPVVSSINRAGANPTNASSVQYNVTFSKNVAIPSTPATPGLVMDLRFAPLPSQPAGTTFASGAFDSGMRNLDLTKVTGSSVTVQVWAQLTGTNATEDEAIMYVRGAVGQASGGVR